MLITDHLDIDRVAQTESFTLQFTSLTTDEACTEVLEAKRFTYHIICSLSADNLEKLGVWSS